MKQRWFCRLFAALASPFATGEHRAGRGRQRSMRALNSSIEQFEPRQYLSAAIAANQLVDIRDFNTNPSSYPDVANTPDGGVVTVEGAMYGLQQPEPAGSAMQLTRYNGDGSLDTSFGNQGHVALSSSQFGSAFQVNGTDGIEVQPDGKIVVMGYALKFASYQVPVLGTVEGFNTTLVVARFNANGAIDQTFGNGGVTQLPLGDVSPYYTGLDLLNNGGLLVTYRLGNPQVDVVPVHAVALLKLTAAGTRDDSFGVGGVATINVPQYSEFSVLAATNESDGDLLVAAESAPVTASASQGASGSVTVVAVNAAGGVDSSFGTGGFKDYPAGIPGASTVVDNHGNFVDTYGPIAATTNANGKFDVLSEYTTPTSDTYAVRQFNTDGTADSTFGNAGVALISPATLSLPFGTGLFSIRDVSGTSDGHILLAGSVAPATGSGSQSPAFSLLFSLDATGNVDTSLGVNGLVEFQDIGLSSTNATTRSQVMQASDGSYIGFSSWDPNTNQFAEFHITPIAGATGLSAQQRTAAEQSIAVGNTIQRTDAPFLALYNPNAGQTVYTVSQAEANGLLALGYQTVAGTFNVSLDSSTGASPIHRLYDPNNGVHYYTLSNDEMNHLVSLGWKYETDAGYIYSTPQPNTLEVYHYYNTQTGEHSFTTNPPGGGPIVVDNPWVQETGLGYVTVSPFDTSPPAAPIASPALTSTASSSGQQAAETAAPGVAPPAAASPANGAAVSLAPAGSAARPAASANESSTTAPGAPGSTAPASAAAAAGLPGTDVAGLDAFWSGPALAALQSSGAGLSSIFA